MISFWFDLFLSYRLLCAYENISTVYAQYKFYIILLFIIIS